MRRERDEKSARIPVRVRAGQIEFLLADEWPPLEEGATGEIVLDARFIRGENWRAALSDDSKRAVEVAPAKTPICLSVKVSKCDRNLVQHVMTQGQAAQMMDGIARNDAQDNLPWNPGNGFQVLGELQTALCLRMVRQVRSQPEPCTVAIPKLQELQRPFEAPSLDEALWLVWGAFEPSLGARAANVFRDVHLLIGQRWVLLEEVRAGTQTQVQDALWQSVGLDPQKVRQRIETGGGLLSNDSTRKTPSR